MAQWDDHTKLSAPTEAPASEQRDRAYLIVLQGSNVGEMYKLNGDSTILGRAQNADIHILDEGISRRHARVVAESGNVFLEDLGSTNGTFLNGKKVVRQVLKDGDKIQVGSTTILKFTYHDRLDESFQRQMYESALRDGLTKIFNKKHLLDRLESEFAFAARHRVALSLVMFDLDHFKRINDTYGHLAGDHVLVTLARLVSETIRSEDVFARYGGEEFALVCRGIDLNDAMAFGERIRRTVEAHEFTFENMRLPVTISVGVSSAPHPEINDAIAFVAAADDALYQAKRGGRNKVCSR